jgi:hypothetical protein
MKLGPIRKLGRRACHRSSATLNIRWSPIHSTIGLDGAAEASHPSRLALSDARVGNFQQSWIGTQETFLTEERQNANGVHTTPHSSAADDVCVRGD